MLVNGVNTVNGVFLAHARAGTREEYTYTPYTPFT